MSVALVSGSGFLGSAIARRLLARGETPVVIHRGHNAGSAPAGAIVELCDRMNQPRLVDIFRARAVDVVVDIMALSADNTRPVIAAAAAIGARYVLTSSVDVYANYGGLLRREQPAVRAEPAVEDSTLRQMRYPYRNNERRPKGVDHALLDDYDKLVLEEMAAAERAINATIIRPPMIFGPGDKQRRFGWAIGAARDAKAHGTPIRLDARAASHENSYGYIEDVGEAFALVATRAEAAGRIYNVGQAHVRTALGWLELFLEVISIGAEIELVAPQAGGLLNDRAEAMDLRYPLTLNSSRIRTELGFHEIVGERDALVKTIADEAARS